MLMGAWRHYGQSFELDATPLECGRSPAAGASPEIIDDDRFVRADLASLIEGEILPRLMLVHQEAVRPSRLLVERRPSPEQIATFSALLLDPSTEDVTGHVLALLDDGLSLDSLLLELLAPAARNLGKLWEEDECDFVDVTIAVGRLHALARDLCRKLESGSFGSHERSILLIPSPGETHTFCLSIVASFFREAGWDVTTSDSDLGLDLLRAEWFDVVGLTLSCDVLLPGLTDVVSAARAASCNRDLRVMVGGPLFVRHPEQLHATGADAMAQDARAAPRIAESLLEKRAQAC
jgi:MerR family transcriptional regulator, light-induced transcriptional regulator